MLEDLIALWWLCAWVFACFVTYHASLAKGLSAGGWVLATVLFGPFALFGLLVMPKNEVELIRRRLAAGTSKVCANCAEPMRAPAIVCPHCRAAQQPIES